MLCVMRGNSFGRQSSGRRRDAGRGQVVTTRGAEVAGVTRPQRETKGGRSPVGKQKQQRLQLAGHETKDSPELLFPDGQHGRPHHLLLLLFFLLSGTKIQRSVFP